MVVISGVAGQTNNLDLATLAGFLKVTKKDITCWCV